MNFLLAEFLHSETAHSMGIANYPTWLAAENLKRLALTMERVRALLGGNPVSISSGYRCHALNEAVGGAANSAHLDGLACDFTVCDFGTPLDICRALEPYVVALDVDQLIAESTDAPNGGWIHLGLSSGEAGHECFSIDSSGCATSGFV